MSQPKAPNILLIFTDQHGLSAVHSYGERLFGGTPCQTPTLDRLAETGVSFETAYTSCPVCTPARGTIITGLYPHSHGMCCNTEDLGCSVQDLVDRPALLSRRLQAAGYNLGYTGKWHLGTDRDTLYGVPTAKALPQDVGFEGQQFAGHGNGGFHYPEYKAYLAEHGWEHKLKPKDGRPYHAWNYGVLEGPVESTVDYFLTEHTIGLIDRFRQQDKPFFIWHNFWGPHNPHWAPQAYYDLYRDVDIPEWPNYRWQDRTANRPFQVKMHPYAEQLTWADWAEAIRHYYAFTTLIDAQIGRLLAHLDATGLRDNTVILFTADHGETLGTHGGLTDKGFPPFDEVQRIPFIVWLPKAYSGTGWRPGEVRQEWVSLADVYPTILELAGVPVDESTIHGHSLLPLLGGGPVSWRDKVFIEFFGVNSMMTTTATVRQGDFKYTWNSSSCDDLYDLSNDPFERKQLIDDPAHQGTVKELRASLEQWMIDTGSPCVGLYRRSRMRNFPY